MYDSLWLLVPYKYGASEEVDGLPPKGLCSWFLTSWLLAEFTSHFENY